MVALYLYSPIRVKYRYGRGALIDLWREARYQHADPVEAWRSIMNNPDKRKQIQTARGKGGFRRFSRDEALEIIAASLVHTITFGSFSGFSAVFPLLIKQLCRVIGWTGAIAAYGPLIFSTLIATILAGSGAPTAFFYRAAVF